MNKYTAKEGYTYTKDGQPIGKELYLGCNDSIDNYKEEADSAIEARKQEEEEKEENQGL